MPEDNADPSDTQDLQTFDDAASPAVGPTNVRRPAYGRSTSDPFYVGPDSAGPLTGTSSKGRSRRWRRYCGLIGVLFVVGAILLPTFYGVVLNIGSPSYPLNELSQLHMAIESYRQTTGEYPPDFSNWELVEAHLRRAFPRHAENLDPSLQLDDQGAKLEDLDPAEALVFWLSGLKDDPRLPISGSGEPLVLFPFDEMRLWDFDGDGWWEYVPAGSSDQETPYVYFDSRTYDQARYPKRNAQPSNQGVAYPYRTTALNADPDKRAVMNPDTFQIISAGLDGDYGADNPVKLFPRGAGYGPGDWDNIANFSDGRILKDFAP
ncbi:MAG: hypothetical protein H8E44_29765 [Planctomycetes bacterium]|nr:hypothetical protein [Planctomycetota bacterium]